MEIQEIIDSFINGNKQQFYNQIKKYSVEDFFIELRNQVNLGLYEERLFIRMTITYFYYNEKNWKTLSRGSNPLDIFTSKC